PRRYRQGGIRSGPIPSDDDRLAAAPCLERGCADDAGGIGPLGEPDRHPVPGRMAWADQAFDQTATQAAFPVRHSLLYRGWLAALQWRGHYRRQRRRVSPETRSANTLSNEE